MECVNVLQQKSEASARRNNCWVICPFENSICWTGDYAGNSSQSSTCVTTCSIGVQVHHYVASHSLVDTFNSHFTVWNNYYNDNLFQEEMSMAQTLDRTNIGPLPQNRTTWP